MGDYKMDYWENARIVGNNKEFKNRPSWLPEKWTLADPIGIALEEIKNLTREEFLLLQKEEYIPPDYKVEDWIEE